MRALRVLRVLAWSAAFCGAAAGVRGDVTPAGGRLSAETPIREIGAKFMLPGDAAAVSIRPLQNHVYVFRTGGASWEETRVNPVEAWRIRETAGEWDCLNGSVRVTVARVGHAPPPKDLDPRCSDVLPETLEGFFASNAPPRSPEGLAAWAAAFRGSAPEGEPERLQPPPAARLAYLLRNDFPDGSALYVLAFARSPATAHLPEGAFAVLLRGKNVPGERLRRFAEQGLFAALRPISSQEAGAFASADRRAAAGPGAGQGVRPHPTREAAHRSIAAMKNWWAIDSEDYVLLSNLHDGNAKKMARDLLEKLQDARAVYAKMAPPFAATKDDVSVIRLFDTEEEYVNYVGAAQKNTCGLYDPSRRELIVRPIAGAGGGRAGKYAEILSTSLHEGFHQFLHQGCGTANASVWLNEGHAALFETLDIHHHRISLPEDKGRMHRLLLVLKANPGPVLPGLLAMDYAQYYAGTHEEVLGHYALGWGFAYFLRRGAPLLRGNPYAQVFPRYFEALRNGAGPEEATRAAFEDIDLAQLEADFRAFFSPQGSMNRNKALRTPIQ